MEMHYAHYAQDIFKKKRSTIDDADYLCYRQLNDSDYILYQKSVDINYIHHPAK